MMRVLLAGLIWMMAATTVAAAGYPRSVTDVSGRAVVLAKEPQRIFLQSGQDLVSLALLDRENPFARIIGWTNGLGDSDPAMWNLIQQRWPAARQVPTLSFDNAGHVDLEALLRLRPDLLVATIGARAAIEGGPIGPILERLGVPVLYIDNMSNPIVNSQKTLALLGRALNRDARATSYLDFYRERFDALQTAIRLESHRPNVFIESRAGRLGAAQCCFSQGKTAWGTMIEALGGRNIGSRLLAGPTGDISLETLIRIKPDLYIMTGTQRIRRGARGIPLGYHGSDSAANAAMATLMARPGFSAIAADPRACVHAMYHQFYSSPFNIVALEYLAQMLYPKRFAALTPDATYRELIQRFTDLPDAPFLFHLQRNHLGKNQCAP